MGRAAEITHFLSNTRKFQGAKLNPSFLSFFSSAKFCSCHTDFDVLLLTTDPCAPVTIIKKPRGVEVTQYVAFM